MLPVKRLIRISVLTLVAVSGALLGMSLDSPRVMIIAVLGAIIGFVVTDYLQRFRIDGLLANITTVVILVLAMKDFLPEDSAGKLVSVANLLVYLQTVLMFQEKTPRLIWQILVLSLLQVVVAAIFSLDFEGGLLFLFYFFVAGTTMALQAIHVGNSETIRRNKLAASRISNGAEIKRRSEQTERSLTNRNQKSNNDPLLWHDLELISLNPLRSLMLHLSMWMMITWVFTAIMFYMIPRHSRPWFGADRIDVTTTGLSKAVDLVNRGQVQQSNQLIFRATFERYGNDQEQIQLTEPAYFRGMALSSMVIEGGKTNWRAPYDRVHNEVYQGLPNPQLGDRLVKQVITLEPTSDPLIHAAMPAFQTKNSRGIIDFCHEISALTRFRGNEKIEWAPFKYELGTYLDQSGGLYKAWPFISNTLQFRQSPMADDVPQSQWLTHYEPSIVPTLVNLASSIAQQARDRNPNLRRIELINEMEQYFLVPGRFRYTLDFRDVRWSENLDPVEDFVRNHRSGHCELFASALTLMLRSQGIPARLVVGFHGGDYNPLTNSLMVRGKHAHAWVEVYLRPEDCTTEMMEQGQAGPGGAWLLADPTPATSAADATTIRADAIEMARTMWQDYVLGMDGEPSNTETVSLPVPLMRILQQIDLKKWDNTIENIKKFDFRRGILILVAALLVLSFLLAWINSLLRPPIKNDEAVEQKAGMLRKWVANAISLISPGISQWVLTGSRKKAPTGFYYRMTEILRSLGLTRNPQQTHREFAREASLNFVDHPSAEMIRSTIWEVTEIFQQIRFGQQSIPEDLRQQIELCLNELNETLQVDLPGKP